VPAKLGMSEQRVRLTRRVAGVLDGYSCLLYGIGSISTVFVLGCKKGVEME
jgi:hypothetical protein